MKRRGCPIDDTPGGGGTVILSRLLFCGKRHIGTLKRMYTSSCFGWIWKFDSRFHLFSILECVIYCFSFLSRPVPKWSPYPLLSIILRLWVHEIKIPCTFCIYIYICIYYIPYTLDTVSLYIYIVYTKMNACIICSICVFACISVRLSLSLSCIAYMIIWYITASPHIFELPFINDHFQVSGATSSRGYGSVVSGVVGAQSFAGARNPRGNDQEKSGLLANHDFIKSHWWVLLPLLAQRIETASTLQRFMYFEWLCCQ